MFYSCSPSDGRGGGVVRPRSGKRGSVTIDIHCHMHTPAADELIADKSPLAMESIVRFATEETNKLNREMLAGIRGKLIDPKQRLADMDRLNIDIQAISPAPFQYYYWAEPEVCRATSRVVNDRLAEIAAEHPDRFVAMATVPLQDTRIAIEELQRVVKQHGMRAIEINTNVNGEELSAERLRPFWARVEELGILVFMHPMGFTEGQRLSDHYLNNLVGQPLESTLAISQLIFGGVLDSYPGLKICIAHGGGFLPVYSGRMDHAYRARSDCRHGVTKQPGEYLKQLYYDTVVFDHDHLTYLVERYGADHLLLGTDYPYDMAEPDPVAFIAGTPALSEAQKDQICGGNAARLLGIKQPAR
jgi:aminocarboxymuconate-semialdehyde decarboxylase